MGRSYRGDVAIDDVKMIAGACQAAGMIKKKMKNNQWRIYNNNISVIPPLKKRTNPADLSLLLSTNLSGFLGYKLTMILHIQQNTNSLLSCTYDLLKP